MLDFGATDGHSNRVRWTDNPILDSVKWYVIAWFQELRATSGGQRFNAWKGNDAGAGAGWGIGFNASTTIQSRHRTSSTNATDTGTFSASVDGEVHAICVAHDFEFGYQRYYLDGTFIGPQSSFAQAIGNAADGFRIGAAQASSGLACRMAQLMIWTSDDGVTPFSVDQVDAIASSHMQGKSIPASGFLRKYVIGDNATTILDLIRQEAGTVDGTVTLFSHDVDAFFQGDPLVPAWREAASRELYRSRVEGMMHTVPMVNSKAAAWEIGDIIPYSMYGIPRAGSLTKNIAYDKMRKIGQAIVTRSSGIRFNPGTRRHTVILEDIEHLLGTFKSTFMVPGSINEGDQDGLAQIDVGAEKVFKRTTDVWLRQSDGLIARIGPGLPAMNHEGYWPFRTHNMVKNSNFSDTSITSGWNDQSGDGSGDEDTANLPWKDTQAYPRCLKITKGSGDTYWEQTGISSVPFFGLTTHGRAALLYDTALGANGGTPYFAIQRVDDSFWFNESTGNFQSGAKVYNELPQTSGWRIFYTKPLAVIDQNTQWLVHVGINSGSIGDTVRFGEIDITSRPFACPLIPTTLNSGGGYESGGGNFYYLVDGDASRQLLYARRNTVRVRVVAKQNASDLRDGDKLTIFVARYGTDSNNWLCGYYEKPAGGNARFAYEMKRAGSIDAQAFFETDIAFGQVVELMFRKTGESDTALGRPRTLSVLVDGVKGTDDYATGDISVSEGHTELWWGQHFDPALATEYLRFYNVIAKVDVQQYALPDESALTMR